MPHVEYRSRCLWARFSGRAGPASGSVYSAMDSRQFPDQRTDEPRTSSVSHGDADESRIVGTKTSEGHRREVAEFGTRGADDPADAAIPCARQTIVGSGVVKLEPILVHTQAATNCGPLRKYAGSARSPPKARIEAQTLSGTVKSRMPFTSSGVD